MRKSSFFVCAIGLLFFLVSTSSFKQESHHLLTQYRSDTASIPSFALARDYKGKSVVNADGTLTLTTGLHNDYFQLDSFSRKGYLYLELATGQTGGQLLKNIPLNLSIVIDRSGSMEGEKMEFAKKAAMGIVDKLSDQDFVSIVIYDEFIDVVKPATQVIYKDSIKAKIAKIRPRGSTNLWGGSEKGYEQVKENFRQNYVNRVLLISDGLVNAGIKIPSRILAGVQSYKDTEGITISTFGVGLDYNETLMTAMAEYGSGNYYFIDKAEKMEPMFARELSGLQNVVAQNAELRITLPKGVMIDKIYPSNSYKARTRSSSISAIFLQQKQRAWCFILPSMTRQ